MSLEFLTVYSCLKRCHAHLKLKCRITQKNSVKFLPAPAAFFGGVFSHTVERCSLTLERMVFLHA